MLDNSPTKPKVLILHAYSPSNLGDKLLIDLVMNQVCGAIGECDFRVICSDAAGFKDSRYIQWRSSIDELVPFAPRRVRMLLTALAGPHTEITRLASGANLVVAVGGGYLRGGHVREAVKSFGAHLGQLRLAARYGEKVLYFPQSIGPFHGVYRHIVRSLLSKVRYVFVRDDRSMQEMNGLVNVHRMPDLAVLELGPKRPDMSSNSTRAQLPGARPVLVARELRKPRNYYRFLAAAKRTGAFDWAVQASGGGNNDEPITKQHSASLPESMSEVLSGSAQRLIISTRLHGALSSIIAGFPAIHLSYERKGWGAFDDLGLGEFVLNARDVSLQQVEDLISELLQDQLGYWEKINACRPKLSEMQQQLTEALKLTITGFNSQSSE